MKSVPISWKPLILLRKRRLYCCLVTQTSPPQNAESGKIVFKLKEAILCSELNTPYKILIRLVIHFSVFIFYYYYYYYYYYFYYILLSLSRLQSFCFSFLVAGTNPRKGAASPAHLMAGCHGQCFPLATCTLQDAFLIQNWHQRNYFPLFSLQTHRSP